MTDSTNPSTTDSSEEETCHENTNFDKIYKIHSEEIVPSQNAYVLHLAASFRNSKSVLITGLSDFRYAVYNIENRLRFDFINEAHKDVITNLKFSSNSEELFYTSSLDGSIKLWDLRTKSKVSLMFLDDTDGTDKLKPINCFDVSCDDKFICGGTPLVEADSYLLFWDIRKASVLGGYWETHTDDITQIKFSPVQPTLMLSGSLDGLINVFDIHHCNEENALQSTLNTNTAIRKLKWLDETIGCITDMETVQFWDLNDVKPLQNFSRTELGRVMLGKPWNSCYVTDIYSTESRISVLGGRNNDFRSALFSNNKLYQQANFENNRQIVRCSCYSSLSDVFITAGENGLVNVWKS